MTASQKNAGPETRAPDTNRIPIMMNPPTDQPSYEAIMLALFENYESLYDIDAETFAYQCYHESDAYSGLSIAGSGEDFFAALSSDIPRVIHPEDQAYVADMLRKEKILSALEKEKYYSIVYRLLIDGKPTYHKVRATLSSIRGRRHILLGVRDVDETVRQEQAHEEALASMYQKEKNHLEAILGSAAGYLEVDLTQDAVLEMSPRQTADNFDTSAFLPPPGKTLRYSDLNEFLGAQIIAKNRQRYAKISSREYLADCFSKGDRRTSVSFSVHRKNGGSQPCREVFYLYRDDASGHIMSFCVIYDLTEQQQKEKELAELEHALQMSRIRNFTSQMQPHFLYNALASIQEIVLDDPNYAAELIGDFTVHLRSCIRAMSSDAPLPFEQELANIRAYVNIEQMRFGRKLRVVYDVPVTDFTILPLSVQPLVENAIRHGIYQRGVKGGTVRIHTRETESHWLVEVEDDGVGFDVSLLKKAVATGDRDSTGLKNIMFRLNTVMHADVDIQSVPGTGTKVTITIPKGVVYENDHC